MPPKRGEVVLCRLPLPSTGRTQHKLRPAVVVSKNPNNRRLDDLIVAPCTSNTSRAHEATQYLIEGHEIARTGIRTPSVVRCEALMSIPKAFVLRTLGRLSPAAEAAVHGCLRDALGL